MPSISLSRARSFFLIGIALVVLAFFVASGQAATAAESSSVDANITHPDLTDGLCSNPDLASLFYSANE